MLGRLYANTLERERRLHFSQDAVLRLFTVTPAGETLLAELRENWSAYPMLTGPANNEEWSLEILESANLAWQKLRTGCVAVLEVHAQRKRFKITQVEQDLSAGHVWRLTLIPTGER
jgi:hypothetical protein